MSTLVRWNPSYRVQPQRRFMPRSYVPLASHWDSRVAIPLDIEENEDSYTVKASVPGFAPEDVKVEVEDGVLVIRAAHEGEHEQEREDWHLRERFAGAVERRLRLGKNVNSETVEAELEHGVLTLTLPKVEEAKPRLIEVNVA